MSGFGKSICNIKMRLKVKGNIIFGKIRHRNPKNHLYPHEMSSFSLFHSPPKCGTFRSLTFCPLHRRSIHMQFDLCGPVGSELPPPRSVWAASESLSSVHLGNRRKGAHSATPFLGGSVRLWEFWVLSPGHEVSKCCHWHKTHPFTTKTW